jgi:heme ABC exporter ATP-binding subunit CcmA
VIVVDRIDVRAVSRHFGRRRVLHDVGFTSEGSEVVGLLGPNGAGKSTLLSILATLLRPSSGEVLYGGRPAGAHGASLRHEIGLLAHDLQLYPELTPRENLRFFGRLHGIPDIGDRVDTALAGAGLTVRADDPVAALSRGLRQRVALERALLHRPRLLLLDEPFTGLDDEASRALIRRLRACAGAGQIVLVATHDLDVAEPLLDRAVVLRGGRAHLMNGGPALRERYRAFRTEQA